VLTYKEKWIEKLLLQEAMVVDLGTGFRVLSNNKEVDRKALGAGGDGGVGG
jgi:hypothetical protein